MPKSELKIHNTISFSNSKAKNKEISILEFLRKNSSIDMTKHIWEIIVIMVVIILQE